MASLESFSESQVPAELIISGVTKIHASISMLESLRPSKIVNSLFTQLVKLCTLPSSIDIHTLPPEVQLMRESLISLCGRAEGLLELEYSIFFSKFSYPLDELTLFPYYGNYVKLALLEYNILCQSGMEQPKSVAFVGSGPMPLTSIVMATRHMTTTQFVNFDIDELANRMARELVGTDAELKRRMKFTTCDIMSVREELGSFDCIFLAALVGMKKEEKVKIIGHIRKYMRSGGLLLVRSANGAKAFLYPIVEEEDLHGFEVVSIFHPKDDVINSVVLVRKPPMGRDEVCLC
ncbi:nicotianamine synthase-like [Aristolochia californica]|uniref:nicotianamine synthase-like n=1 Tax=Aristolochia californica TaxID=171875 RepID=UPI0035E1530E